MKKIRVLPMDKQRDEVEFYLHEDLINFVHIASDLGEGEFTVCGNCYVDCEYKEVNEVVNCKKCLETLRYYKAMKLKDAFAVEGEK